MTAPRVVTTYCVRSAEVDIAPPELTAIGELRFRERFLAALDVDLPDARRLTDVQKAAYLRWLDYYLLPPG